MGRHSLLLNPKSYNYARSHCCKFIKRTKHSAPNLRTSAIKSIVQKGSAIKIIVKDKHDVNTNSTSKNKAEKVCIKHIPKNREDNFILLYVFFWIFPRRPIVVCRHFGTLYRFHLQGLDVEYEV